MRDETKQNRQKQIEDAAYAVIEAKGYAGASMQGIARKARASNETLYNWYGDKTGLFKALVDRNAQEVRVLLEQQIAGAGDALATLRDFGPLLLVMLTSPRAIALNRAAAADPTGALGAALAEHGRETILPLVAEVLDQVRAQESLHIDDKDAALDLYMSLLLGDVQIRCATGSAPPLLHDAARARADRALSTFLHRFR